MQAIGTELSGVLSPKGEDMEGEAGHVGVVYWERKWGIWGVLRPIIYMHEIVKEWIKDIL